MDLINAIKVAENYIDDKNYAEAKKILIELLKEYPEEGAVLYDCGIIATAMCELKMAKYYFLKSIEKEYKIYQSLISLAMVEGAIGNSDATIELLKHAVRMEKKNSVASRLLFEEYMDNSDYEAAQEIARSLMEKHKEDYCGYHNYALVLLRMGESAKARAHLLNINSKFGKCQEYIYDFVSILFCEEEYDKALKYLLENEIYVQTDSEEHVTIKARIASKVLDIENAMVGFDVLSQKYNYDYATLNTALLKLALGDFKEADKELVSIIEKEKMDLNYFHALLFHAGVLNKIELDEDIVIEAYQQAIDVYERIYKEDKTYSFVLEYASECYAFLGDKKKQESCKERLKNYYQSIG